MKRGWTTKPIGEVATIKPPKSEARERVAADALVSFLPMEDLGVAVKFPEPKQVRKLSDVVGSYTYFAEADVLLAKITPCFENGKLGIAKGLKNGIGFGSSEFIVLRPYSAITSEWLFYFLSRDDFRSEGAQRMGGAVGQQRVPKEFLEACQIPIPPLSEQQRIVSILDKAFDGFACATANAEQNLRNARALFESHLQSVFSKRGNGWVETTLGDVCEFENGDRGKNYPNRNEYVQSGIPWINTGHIQPDGTLSMKEMNFITREKFDSLRSGKIQPGDLVYCLRGATLGKTALVTPLTEGAIASSLVIVRPSPLLDSTFLYFFLISPAGQGLIKGFENGAAQPNLGARSVAKYPLSIPPARDQRRIVERLMDLRQETQRLESIYQQKLAALNELKKSLLHQAFSGQL